jgi:phenylalanyl-tRNA synthetase beta chain
MDDQTFALPERKPVTLRVARAAKVIGMPVTQAQCAGVMQRLGLQFTQADGVLGVTPPSWRFDLQIEEDLIEEVIRVLGYGSLPETPPIATLVPRVRVFEIGRVFMREPKVADGELSVAGIHQPMRIAGLAYGSADALQWASKERAVDFFDVKGDVEALFAPKPVRFVAASHPAMHPGRCAGIEADGRPVGHIGELHPRWRQGYELPNAPVLFELELEAVLEREIPQFKPIQRQQSAWRDLSLVASESVTHTSLMQAVHATPTALVRSARLYDIYKPASPSGDIGAGERSMTVRLELLDDENTLTDERIDAVVAQVLANLSARLGVRLRG